MPRARKHLVCLETTPYYHVTSRCVRRAFLCGIDRTSGRSYEHRRSWIEARIRILSSLFSISLCAYAVMSNHYHLVVKVEPEVAKDWDDMEVLKRWSRLFKGPLLVQSVIAGDRISAIEWQTVKATAAVYRERLGSLSWFMRCLNEPIARRANAEDACTGHFWEARFHSQALCSERALLCAMAYVDLNPIRAGMARSLEDSDYTSIQTRLAGLGNIPVPKDHIVRLLKKGKFRQFDRPLSPMIPFETEQATTQRSTLPIRQEDYLTLLEQTARTTVLGKKGFLSPKANSALTRLRLSSHEWLRCATDFKTHFRNGDLRLKASA